MSVQYLLARARLHELHLEVHARMPAESQEAANLQGYLNVNHRSSQRCGSRRSVLFSHSGQEDEGLGNMHGHNIINGAQTLKGSLHATSCYFAEHS